MQKKKIIESPLSGAYFQGLLNEVQSNNIRIVIKLKSGDQILIEKQPEKIEVKQDYTKYIS